jgi:transglutaminase-like putative cysteine protease
MMLCARLVVIQKVLTAIAVTIATAATAFCQEQQADPIAERTLQFTTRVSVRQPESPAQIRVWIPVPLSTADQTVRQVAAQLPATHRLTQESAFGNRMLYVEMKSAKKSIAEYSVTWEVVRREVRSGLQSERTSELTAEQRQRFLAANRRVPIDGLPLTLLHGKSLPELPVQKCRVIYDTVLSHMMYDKSRPGYGLGDAVWACESRYGNCSDFHSLFISLARSQGVPARFEIGFPLPPDQRSGTIGGNHCWAWFLDDHRGWVPVDISEADKHPAMADYYFGNLTADRVALSTGRDLVLEPAQAAEPLNFFVYPYVEINGVVPEADVVKTEFSFRDID